MQRTHSHDLDPIWLRAAMLGSSWAAVEIILGSFLHNIRFPLTGTILACIGIVILVAGGRLWPERGLFWRSGLICALMKSISPSAVIIGPMIGIMSEALVVEIAVRTFGPNPFGFAVGGAVAALFPLLQKIATLVITYGPDIASLYIRLVEFASEKLTIPSLGPAELLAAFSSLNFALGLAAVATGLSVGRRVRSIPREQAVQNGSGSPFALPGVDPRQSFSLALLGMHAAALVLGFLAIRLLPFWAGLAYVASYVILAIGLYPAILKRLSRPRLWLEFAIISLLAGFLLGEVGGTPSGVRWSGLQLGAEMSLRASLVVVGFSCIGIELRNPVIVGWLLRRGLGQLSAALGVAFEALPQMISALGDQKRFFRSPVQALARTIAAGVEYIPSIAQAAHGAPPIVLITGEPSAGKTTFLSGLIQELKSESISVGGILAPGQWMGGERSGFEVVDLRSGRSHPLCRRISGASGITAGPFVFDPGGLSFGAQAIERALDEAVQVLCIDEIGPLELEGRGWSSSLRSAHARSRGVLVLVVRSSLIEEVQKSFGIRPEARWNAATTDRREALEHIRLLLAHPST